MGIDISYCNFGIVGRPDLSIAPYLYSQFFVECGINGGCSRFELQEADELPVLVHFLERFKFNRIQIEAGYKQSIIQHLHEADDRVMELGVADTLYCKDIENLGGWKGYNTDSYGFQRLVEIENINLSGKNILIAGAGAACRAVLYTIKKLKTVSVTVVNRNEKRVEDLRERFPDVDINYLKYQDLNHTFSFDVVINTTSADWGNKIWQDHFLGGVDSLKWAKGPELAIDFNYSQADSEGMTPFLSLWGSSINHNGLLIFAEKAVKSFEILFGARPNYVMDDLKKMVYSNRL